ncbi:MAG: hypothetical protein R2789_15860 [Microthrixaceae bacterium]
MADFGAVMELMLDPKFIAATEQLSEYAEQECRFDPAEAGDTFGGDTDSAPDAEGSGDTFGDTGSGTRGSGTRVGDTGSGHRVRGHRVGFGDRVRRRDIARGPRCGHGSGLQRRVG